ncbi:ChbG/HpnK family deacetylase [Babesia caballi]|uniref:ChbG/HpnK family deacetylase n=1 Tax=Babesia caballi TaxID=5871 RepID=A0AAV4LWE6_BABCB|nr:ChbG/HpnK family deacetylase [Babesia caballi]
MKRHYTRSALTSRCRRRGVRLLGSRQQRLVRQVVLVKLVGQVLDLLHLPTSGGDQVVHALLEVYLSARVDVLGSLEQKHEHLSQLVVLQVSYLPLQVQGGEQLLVAHEDLLLAERAEMADLVGVPDHVVALVELQRLLVAAVELQQLAGARLVERSGAVDELLLGSGFHVALDDVLELLGLQRELLEPLLLVDELLGVHLGGGRHGPHQGAHAGLLGGGHLLGELLPNLGGLDRVLHDEGGAVVEPLLQLQLQLLLGDVVELHRTVAAGLLQFLGGEALNALPHDEPVLALDLEQVVPELQHNVRTHAEGGYAQQLAHHLQRLQVHLVQLELLLENFGKDQQLVGAQERVHVAVLLVEDALLEVLERLHLGLEGGIQLLLENLVRALLDQLLEKLRKLLLGQQFLLQVVVALGVVGPEGRGEHLGEQPDGHREEELREGHNEEEGEGQQL